MGGGSFPRASPRPVKWIPQLALIALVNGQTLSPKAACSQPFRLASLPERFNDPAPAEIVLQVLGRHAMERAQLFLQATVVTIDVVDMKIGRFRSGAAWLRQDAAGDFRLAGKTDDRLAAIAAELVVRRDDMAKRGRDRGSVAFGQYRIGGLSEPVTCHQNRDLLCRQRAGFCHATALVCGPRQTRTLALE